MNDHPFDAPLRELYRLFFSIEQAVAYIAAEILKLETGPDTRAAVVALCGRFRGLLQNVRQEIDALVDILLIPAHPGQDEAAGAVPSGDPRAPLGRIDKWLRDGIEPMHALVMDLREREKTDPGIQPVLMLCQCLGADILAFYSEMKEPLRVIADQWPAREKTE
ncbi:MAG: hypothetical protein ACE15F_01845 [bacterium]